jgi:hypothetical protein
MISTIPAHIALAAQAQCLPVVEAGRDGDVEGAPIGQGQPARGAECRLDEGDGKLVALIDAAHALLPLLWTGPERAALAAILEKVGEDVVKRGLIGAAGPGATVASALRTLGIATVELPLRRALLPGGIDFTAIEAGAFFGVG